VSIQPEMAPAPELSRRQVLAGLSGAGIAAVLAGCTRSTGTSASPPASNAASSGTTAPTGTSPAAADWSRLAAALTGLLLRPGSSGYAAAAELYNPRFDAVSHPAAIARCAGVGDVAACVRFAAQSGTPFAIRAGGHSYGGWSTSTGLVIDIRNLATVQVDRAASTARIGAGAHLVNVYSALSAAGVGVAAGSCPSVGMAGLTLGGGVGVLTRAWGLTCDAVRSIGIVTADGNVREVDAHRDPDLFWALRGGAGGSFGAVTGFTVETRAAPTVHTFYFDWSLGIAPDVVDAWQRWMSTADSRLWSTCKLLADPGPGTMRALVAGTWIGPASSLTGLLAGLVSRVGASPAHRSASTLSYADAMLAEAGCSGSTAAQCLARALQPPSTQPFAATSSIAAGLIPRAGIELAEAQTRAALSVPGLVEGGVSFDALGGAVATVAPGDTAFVHRRAAATVQYTATWAAPSAGGVTANAAPFDAYVHTFRAAMVPWFGSSAYVNYADRTIVDYPAAYCGANYPRLQAVKRQYDPHELFTFPQAVRG
jgi:FAD/FMN-containing dehydrogenase